jgi:hypothetical protein
VHIENRGVDPGRGVNTKPEISLPAGRAPFVRVFNKTPSRSKELKIRKVIN